MQEEMTMEQLLAEEEAAAGQEIKEKEVVEGTVILVNRDEAFVDIGYKQEIPIPKRELRYPAPESAEDVVKVGDVVDAKITEIDYDAKKVSLSMRALLADEELPEENTSEDNASEESDAE